MSNFDFLRGTWSNLADMGERAERNLYTEPNTSVLEMGKIAEQITSDILREEHITLPQNKNSQADRIEALSSAKKIFPEVERILYRIKQARNAVAHESFNMSMEETKGLLCDCFNLCCWFYSCYFNDAQFPRFVMPEDPRQFAKQRPNQNAGQNPNNNQNPVVHDLGAQSRAQEDEAINLRRRKRMRGLIITSTIMSILFAFSAIINVYQYVSYIGLLDAYETNNGYQVKSFQELDFFMSHVLVKKNNDSEKHYHKFWCEGADIANGYKIISIEEAEREGYTPCPSCFKN